MSTPAPFDSSALIPWYLNGTLSPAERGEVEAWLVATGHDGDLKLWRAVQSEVRSEIAEPATDLGWRRLRTELRPARQTIWQWRAALAAGVVAVASFQMLILWRQGHEGVHRPLSAAVAFPEAWRFQVRFVETATARDINALLLRMDAQIVSGPSALGIYEIAIPRREGAEADGLLNLLRHEPLIEQATLAP